MLIFQKIVKITTATLFVDDKKEVHLTPGISVQKNDLEYYLDLGKTPNQLRIPLNMTAEVRENTIYHAYIRVDDRFKYRIAHSDPTKSIGILLLVKGVTKVQGTRGMTIYLVHGDNQLLLIHDPKSFRGCEISFVNGTSTYLDKKTLLEILD